MLVQSLLLITTFTVGALEGSKGGAGWSYTGPRGRSHWGELSNSCRGEHQSPINIDLREVVRKEGGEILFHNYQDLGEKIDLINNGHTIQFTPSDQSPFISSDTAFTGYYHLRQFHFHWGHDRDRGSEHNINLHKFSLEMHAVHESEEEPGKLLVVAYFFREVEGDPSCDPKEHNIEGFLDTFKHTPLHEEGERDSRNNLDPDITQDVFDLSPINGHDGILQRFCTYQGSLTTPPCSEGVTWILDMHVRNITSQAMGLFHNQTDLDHHPLDDNFRDLQPLHGRSIVCNNLRGDDDGDLEVVQEGRRKEDNSLGNSKDGVKPLIWRHRPVRPAGYPFLLPPFVWPPLAVHPLWMLNQRLYKSNLAKPNTLYRYRKR